jgi:hypothetical protein
VIFKHAVGYRQICRTRCIPTRDLFPAPIFTRQATELRCLEGLPWPRNLFGEPASIAELMDEATQLSAEAGEDSNHACRCGCRRAHNHNVSQTLRHPYDRGFDVMYFWSEACKSKWNRQRMREPASAF